MLPTSQLDLAPLGASSDLPADAQASAMAGPPGEFNWAIHPWTSAGLTCLAGALSSASNRPSPAPAAVFA